MQQIKIFKSLEYDIDRLEKEINDWLAQSRARVLQLVGNIAPQSEGGSKSGGSGSGSGTNPSDVVVFILYEKA